MASGYYGGVSMASGWRQDRVSIVLGWRNQNLMVSQGVNQASRVDTYQK